MPWLLLPCRVAMSGTVWHTIVAGLDASLLVWIMWRLAEQRLLARRAPSKSLNAISPTRTTTPPATHAKVTMVASLEARTHLAGAPRASDAAPECRRQS